MEQLSKNEVKGVLAHEITHIRNYDSVGSILMTFLSSVMNDFLLGLNDAIFSKNKLGFL